MVIQNTKVNFLQNVFAKVRDQYLRDYGISKTMHRFI